MQRRSNRPSSHLEQTGKCRD